MKMKQIALTVGLMGMAAAAQAEVSANIGVTSNYLWRGVTQTNNGAAIQGGVDYSHEKGVYLGVWTSNVDFGGNASNDTGTEVDVYGGLSGKVSGFDYDVGYIKYHYPQHQGIDFSEVYGSLGYTYFTAGVSYQVDGGSSFADKSGNLYTYLSAQFDMANHWSVGATVGLFDYTKKNGDDDYTLYQVDLTKATEKFGDFMLSVSKLGTKSSSSLDDNVLVTVSWSKSFE